MEYILRSDTEDLFGEVRENISQIFTLFQHVCFVGHTHDPGVITEDSQFLRPMDFVTAHGLCHEPWTLSRYMDFVTIHELCHDPLALSTFQSLKWFLLK